MKVLKRVQLEGDVVYDLRLPVEKDVPLITNSWLKEYRASPSTQGLSDGKYYYTQHDNIQKLLRKDTAMVLVACSADNPDLIYGYIVADRQRPTIHWVHVKNKFRQFGIGSSLVQFVMQATGVESTITHTHKTKHAEHLSKLALFVYKPLRWIELHEQANHQD